MNNNSKKDIDISSKEAESEESNIEKKESDVDSKKNHFRIFVLPIIIVSLLTSIDQLLKFIISTSFKLYETKPIIKDVLEITYIRNEGVAWGLFQGKRIIFLILTVIVLLACFYIYSHIDNNKKFLPLRICIIVLISGAVGNMLDRIRLGYVIDFIYFKLIDFPVFNFADILVVLSMIFLFILVLFKYTNEDIDEILGVKKNG